MAIKDITHFKFEYTGKTSEIRPIIDAFNAYLKANAGNNLDIAISAMRIELQEKLQDIEQTHTFEHCKQTGGCVICRGSNAQ